MNTIDRLKVNGSRVKTIIHKADILQNGWESDNEAWIVELEDGNHAAITTRPGCFCEWTKKEAGEKLSETEASAASIRKALEIWPDEKMKEMVLP